MNSNAPNPHDDPVVPAIACTTIAIGCLVAPLGLLASVPLAIGFGLAGIVNAADALKDKSDK